MFIGKGYNVAIRESEKEHILDEWYCAEHKKPKKNDRIIGYNRAHHTFFIGRYTREKKNSIGIKTDAVKFNEFDNPVNIYMWVTHWKPFNI